MTEVNEIDVQVRQVIGYFVKQCTALLRFQSGRQAARYPAIHSTYIAQWAKVNIK